MMRLGVSETYVDAFCGRVPKSVLARHYTDFSPGKLSNIYSEASMETVSATQEECNQIRSAITKIMHMH